MTNTTNAVKPRIYNAIEIHPVSDALIIIRQNGNAITLTLDQIHFITSDLCTMAADMRESLRGPWEDVE